MLTASKILWRYFASIYQMHPEARLTTRVFTWLLGGGGGGDGLAPRCKLVCSYYNTKTLEQKGY